MRKKQPEMSLATLHTVALLCLSLFVCYSYSSTSERVIDAIIGMDFEAIGRDTEWNYKGSVFAQGGTTGIRLAEFQGVKLHRRFFYSYPANTAAVQTVRDGQYQCVSADQVPPLRDLLSSPITPLATEQVSEHISDYCSAQNLYHIVFTNHVYVLCVDKQTEKATHLFGKEFKATFSPSKKQTFFQPKIRCESTHEITQAQKVRQSNVIDKSHQRWWRRENPSDEITAEKSAAAQRHCIFIHGSGQKGFSDPTTEFPAYWGKVHEKTPQCKTRQFLHMETLALGWNSTQLQKLVCAASTFDQPSNDKFKIKNKIIFSHSMGNLILAGAIKNGLCDVDTTTTNWYAVAKPANGSTVAATLKSLCSDIEIETQIEYLQGICVNHIPGEAYLTLLPTFPGLASLFTIFEQKTKGALCGTSAAGLVSPYAAALSLVAKLGKLEKPNDGMVWYDSCNIATPGIDPSNSPTSNYYVGGLNHADSTCRNGDGWWGDGRQPCLWYTNMV